MTPVIKSAITDELNHLDMLQDFKDSKLVVQVDNSFQSEKLIDYLRKMV